MRLSAVGCRLEPGVPWKAADWRSPWLIAWRPTSPKFSPMPSMFESTLSARGAGIPARWQLARGRWRSRCACSEDEGLRRRERRRIDFAPRSPCAAPCQHCREPIAHASVVAACQTQAGVTVFAPARYIGKLGSGRDHLVLDDGRRLRRNCWLRRTAPIPGCGCWNRGPGYCLRPDRDRGQFRLRATASRHGVPVVQTRWRACDAAATREPHVNGVVYRSQFGENLMSMAPAQLCARVRATGAACGALELISPPAAFRFV